MSIIKDWALYEANAAPESITAHLAQARAVRRRIDREITRLEDLLVRRVTEKAAGDWPPKEQQ